MSSVLLINAIIYNCFKRKISVEDMKQNIIIFQVYVMCLARTEKLYSLVSVVAHRMKRQEARIGYVKIRDDDC